MSFANPFRERRYKDTKKYTHLQISLQKNCTEVHFKAKIKQNFKPTAQKNDQKCLMSDE